MADKWPVERTQRLIAKLHTGEALTLVDRMLALWFIRKVSGFPEPDPAEQQRLDNIINEWAADKAAKMPSPTSTE